MTLHYDGHRFLGWQLQPRGRTVQGELEHALFRLTGERRRVTGSGRTDRGVHATGQVAAVTLPPRWADERELRRGLNALLPDDIWVEELRRVPLPFHPRFHAVRRTYLYRIGLVARAASPFHHRWCWALDDPLDIDLLHRSAAFLPGNHPFGSFAKAGQEKRGERCMVREAAWEPWEETGLTFRITANRFLHHMVRYLVGTMVDVARRRRPPDDVPGLLEGRDSHLTTSPPAPPQGLFLARVDYGRSPLPDGEDAPEGS